MRRKGKGGGGKHLETQASFIMKDSPQPPTCLSIKEYFEHPPSCMHSNLHKPQPLLSKKSPSTAPVYFVTEQEEVPKPPPVTEQEEVPGLAVLLIPLLAQLHLLTLQEATYGRSHTSGGLGLMRGRAHHESSKEHPRGIKQRQE